MRPSSPRRRQRQQNGAADDCPVLAQLDGPATIGSCWPVHRWSPTPRRRTSSSS